MLKDVLWTSPTKRNLDPLVEKQKYNEKIIELVQHRTTTISQIRLSLCSGKEKCYFLKIVDIQEYTSALEEKYEKNNILLKNFLVLGSLLSAVLGLSNSLEKLVIVWKMLIDYQDFVERAKNQREKFLISDLPRISFHPPSTNIDISIVENTQTVGKLTESVNNLLDLSGVMQKLSKKMIKINGNKYSFYDKKIFTEYLESFYKAFSVPTKLSYSVIVASTCEMLLLVYNSVLTDEMFSNKESFDIIEQIDAAVHTNFLKLVLGDLHYLSAVTTQKEFEILERSLEANFGRNSKAQSRLEALLS